MNDDLQDNINKNQEATNSRQDKFNDKQELVNAALFKHAEIANNEMGVIKTDIQWMKIKIDSFDSKIWSMIVGIGLTLVGVLTSLIAILRK